MPFLQKNFSIEIQLTYNIVSVSGVQHSGSTFTPCELITTINVVTICYQSITILLTTYPMLYITSLRFIYFITGSLFLLNPLHLFSQPAFPLVVTSLFFVSMNLFLFCLFICFVF